MDAQRLEEDTEEPGQQDVAGDQPGQLLTVLFTVTNGHFVHVIAIGLFKNMNGVEAAAASSSRICGLSPLTSSL
jgi:hypothetical protein